MTVGLLLTLVGLALLDSVNVSTIWIVVREVSSILRSTAALVVVVAESFVYGTTGRPI